MGQLQAEFYARERARSPEPYQGRFPIVALGGSAGAIEESSKILTGVSPDAGLAYVVVQHLMADQPSQLTEILARTTGLAVVTAAHDQAVAPNTVYVSPPNYFVGIVRGTLKLLPRPARPAQFMPIDFFLRCLAEDQSQLAIAVILSGADGDGAEGVRAIRAQGGLVLVQDPVTAQVANMPESAIATGAADRVLRVPEMAAEIERLGRSPLISLDIDPLKDGEMALNTLFSQIKRRTGVDFAKYKRATIARRMRRRMLLHRVFNLWDYQRILFDSPQEMDCLYRDLLIGVTSFFRDPSMYDELKNAVLPPLLNRGAADHRPFRFWVPGCSTGEEVYSLAMCIVEAQEMLNIVRPIQIFASDTNDLSLDVARAGVYRESITTDVSPARLRKFFTKVPGGYQVSQPLRELCVFAKHNVTTDPPFSRLDGVSCRNLLIYLDPAVQKNVVSLFAYALNIGGALILGASETPGNNEAFVSVGTPARIFLKREAVAPSSLSVVGALERVSTPVAPQLRPALDPLNHRDREANRLLLDRYAPAGVMVSSRMQILQFRGATGDYLEAASGEASLNLFKMARPGLDSELRILVREAEETRGPARRESVVIRDGAVRREISVEVIPFKLVTDEILYLISFAPVLVASADAARAGSPVLPESEAVRTLERELVSVKHHLQSIIRDQDTNNAALQSANEEVLCSNEELQSINEELQTAKEELQSTNEELSTVNDELLHRNELLQRSTNDLSNLLASVDLPIVMVGQDLRLRRFTPSAAKLLNLLGTDVGRPLTQIRPNVELPNLESMVTESIDAMRTIELEVKDQAGVSYSLRVRPYRTAINQIDGAVIVLVRQGPGEPT